MAKNRLQLCGDFLYSQRSARAVSAVAAGEILCLFFKAVAAENAVKVLLEQAGLRKL